MRQTALRDHYEAHHAKVVDFHGWALPIQFSGIVEEHLHTRKHAGVFDCSHMGEFLCEGQEAIAAVDGLVCSDFVNLPVGRCRYSAILNEKGGIIDDCVALRLKEDLLYLVTNAGPVEDVGDLLQAQSPAIRNLSEDTAKIDVQGPNARKILLELGFEACAPLKFWNGLRSQWEEQEIIITRAGYTGELGYELYIPNEIAGALWDRLLDHPETMACGLGARDTLRTEMGYPLNGEDVTEEKTPMEASMDRFIAWDSPFPGKERILAQKEQGAYAVLMPVQSHTRQAPRPGFDVKKEGETVGVVTSGTYGPSVGAGVGLAYIPKALAIPGTAFTAGPRNLSIDVADGSLYKEGTCRVKVD